MTYQEKQDLNTFIKTHSFHYGSDKEFSITILKNYSLNVDELFSKGIIEYTGETTGQHKNVRWTFSGKILWQRGDWDSYLEFERMASVNAKQQEEKQYLDTLEKKIKEQQVRLNDLELKIKPEAHKNSKIALVLSVIALLASLLQWLIPKL